MPSKGAAYSDGMLQLPGLWIPCQGLRRKKIDADTCYQCGTKRRMSKNCTQDNSTCLACKMERHRVNSIACPKFKDCVESMRKSKAQKAAPTAQATGATILTASSAMTDKPKLATKSSKKSPTQRKSSRKNRMLPYTT